MRSSSRVARLAVFVLAVALAAASRAYADGAPPPDPPPPPPPPPPIAFDTTSLGYIRHVQIGTSPCDTCPPRVCPGEPIVVTISGLLPSPCFKFRGFRDQPVDADRTLLIADFAADTCVSPCGRLVVPFTASLALDPALQLSNGFTLLHQVRGCPDTTLTSAVERPYAYAVEPSCVMPPPLDSLVRSFVSFEVTPAQRCPGDTLSIKLKKNGCPPCVRLSSFTYDSASTLRAVVEWQPDCMEFACNAESLSVALGAFAAGSFVVQVPVDVHVLGTGKPDSTISFLQVVRFDVPRCVAACVVPNLPSGPRDPASCAATVPRGGTGVAVMPLWTGLDVWGAQGWLLESAPTLHIVAIEPANAGPGAQVSWRRDGQFVRFVAFSTGNAPLASAGLSPFLRITVEIDANADPSREFVDIHGLLEQAAGRTGDPLAMCPLPADLPSGLRVCILSPSDTCDANGDGRADVRDLVRMVRCLRPDTTGLDTARTCRDCTGDGLFDLRDLFCCARHILRAPQVPRDSSQVSDAVFVGFGQFRREGNGWRVPVRVSGAGPLAGSLLRLRYPAERWRVGDPRILDYRTEANTEWMPLADFEEPGVVQVGWLKVGEGHASELTFEFVLVPIGEPGDADVLSVEGADLVLPDGSTLTPVGDLPAVSLIAPFEPPHVPPSLELSPARPNPFTSTTLFSVSLPRESMVELTVHDIAGRVVATLARGRFAAGSRQFEWDGAGARDGVYFARLSVDGHVLSQRVALLRARP